MLSLELEQAQHPNDQIRRCDYNANATRISLQWALFW